MDLSLVGRNECTDQFVSDLVYHVGVVKTSSLVLPPAPDVDTWFLFKIGKMEVIPVKYKYTDSAQTPNYYKFKQLLPVPVFIIQKQKQQHQNVLSNNALDVDP